jgi:hypothetical protein
MWLSAVGLFWCVQCFDSCFSPRMALALQAKRRTALFPSRARARFQPVHHLGAQPSIFFVWLRTVHSIFLNILDCNGSDTTHPPPPWTRIPALSTTLGAPPEAESIRLSESCLLFLRSSYRRPARSSILFKPLRGPCPLPSSPWDKSQQRRPRTSNPYFHPHPIPSADTSRSRGTRI